jgi:hypothetical protein
MYTLNTFTWLLLSVMVTATGRPAMAEVFPLPDQSPRFTVILPLDRYDTHPAEIHQIMAENNGYLAYRDKDAGVVAIVFPCYSPQAEALLQLLPAPAMPATAGSCANPIATGP